MIIDSITLGGDKAYFDFVASGSGTPSVARIPKDPLSVGKGYAISGVSIQLEAADLLPLFQRQPNPLLRLSVQKEMFPALFAPPYQYRIHNVSGYEDFNRGVYTACKAIDVEGVPTIVSFGDDATCSWRSPIYPMPEGIVIDKIAWDMAVSRLTPQANFTYSLELDYWVGDVSPPNTKRLQVVANADPTQLRHTSSLNLTGNPVAYSIDFTAKVLRDSNIYESYASNPFDAVGTPLLRAVYVMEKIAPAFYEFYSLKELLDHCVDVHLFETPGPAVTKLTATLSLNALLVQSDNQVDPNGRGLRPDDYEYVELTVAPNVFSFVEAMAKVREAITPPKAIQQP
jgi:hypothetical protein